MTRIIAGTAGGRRLAVPRGRTTRPTSDRDAKPCSPRAVGTGHARGTAGTDPAAPAHRAGSALPGAAHALLVEADRRATAVVTAYRPARTARGAVVDRGARPVPRPDGGPYDFVFADPPYAIEDREVTAVLEALRDHGWLTAGTLIVVERSSRKEPMGWPDGYQKGKVRQYGETSLWYGHAASLPDRD